MFYFSNSRKALINLETVILISPSNRKDTYEVLLQNRSITYISKKEFDEILEVTKNEISD